MCVFSLCACGHLQFGNSRSQIRIREGDDVSLEPRTKQRRTWCTILASRAREGHAFGNQNLKRAPMVGLPGGKEQNKGSKTSQIVPPCDLSRLCLFSSFFFVCACVCLVSFPLATTVSLSYIPFPFSLTTHSPPSIKVKCAYVPPRSLPHSLMILF